jgi:Icc-related predicted phosphoesterase
MSLTSVRILQVGDLHLPSVIDERRNVDDKDKSFSFELKNRISASPTKVVYQKLYELISKHLYDSVLFMGDLTNRGNLKNFDQAAKYLAQSLQIGSGRQNQNVQVGIVPGNHDINRKLAGKPSALDKFSPLNAALLSHGLPPIPVERETLIEVAKSNANAKIFLLNSCWGCGAKEYIPEKFREVVHSAIEGMMTNEESEEFGQYYDRQLDTPAFSNETISRVSEARVDTPDDTVEIYVAHHNLLPQRLPRLAPYTELVNSGAMRAVLTDGKKPTVYLHGHIHEDPVEVISAPQGSNLISISSPLSSDGFNEVEIVYTATGLPMSCIIHPWRFSNAGVLKKQERIVVPLVSGRRLARDRSLPQLLSYILQHGQVYWSQIERHDPPFYEAQTSETLEEGIEMLMALQSIQVENYSMKPQHWIIRSNL